MLDWLTWSVQLAPPSVVCSSSPDPWGVRCSAISSHPLSASVKDMDVVAPPYGEMVIGPSGILVLIQLWVMEDRRNMVMVALPAFGGMATHWWPSGRMRMLAVCSCASKRPGGVMSPHVAPKLSVHSNACWVWTYPCPPGNSTASLTSGPAKGCWLGKFVGAADGDGAVVGSREGLSACP